MSGRISRRRVPLLLVLVLVGALTPAGPALGVTKTQVDRACSTSAGAYEAYLSAKSEFQAAADAYEAAALEVENVLYRQQRAAETLGIRQADMEVAKDRFEQQAVEAYMNGGSANPALFFMASSLDEVITSTEFLSSAASDEQDIAGDLAALQGRGGAQALRCPRLTCERWSRTSAPSVQEEACSLIRPLEELSCECANLQSITTGRRAGSRLRGGTPGVSAATPGLFARSGSSFIDSWGTAAPGTRPKAPTCGAYGPPSTRSPLESLHEQAVWGAKRLGRTDYGVRSITPPLATRFQRLQVPGRCGRF